jgi:phenylpropionate dioxygenase-like ring-hydroxylating dioxygenase large terminal subunit
MDDDCSHRGASLGLGFVKNNNVICPYHGYEFDNTGKLCVVPGLNFTNSNCQNQITYNIIEKNGWVFLNTISKNLYNPSVLSIFEEEEATQESFSPIFLNVHFNAYARIVSENSLDVMHIGFVHTFGNKERPSPITEIPPFLVNDYTNHYKTVYTYHSGDKSVAKKIYGMKKLKIENEFIMPHTTIARVIFGDYTSTVMTFATPINETNTCLYVKTYRNFWYIPKANENTKKTNENKFFDQCINKMGDFFSTHLMMNTVLEDKVVIENIKMDKIDGKFNMKYDKLQNIYRQIYKKKIHTLNK